MTNTTDARTAPPIRPASTILLLRDRPHGLEVFMVVRHQQIDFASGALVFPGGKAEPDDFDDRFRARMDSAVADDESRRGLMVAAIREVYEEAGVLLARPRDDASHLVSAERLLALEPDRDRLNAGTISFLEIVEREDLVLACDQLTTFAHWITPDIMPKRFDTWFYLAIAPSDQIAIHDGHESVDSVWIRPQQALEDAAAGRRTVIFPTLRNVEKLARSATATDALAAARASKVVTVLPWTEKRDGTTYLCITPDAGYDVNEEKMHTLR